MKRLLILGVFAFCAWAAHAQEPETAAEPDSLVMVEQRFIMPIHLTSIKNTTSDEAAYRELVSKFEQGSDELGLYDVSLIYFGWVFKPEYKGNRDAEHSSSERLMSEGKFEQAWDEGLKYLKDNPVSLLTLHQVLNAGNALGKSGQEMAALTRRYDLLMQLIYYTGDGQSEQTAFKVISISDEHVFMNNFLGVSKTARRIITRAGVDCFDVVNARRYDKRYLYIDATFAQHFGPAWIPEEAPEESGEGSLANAVE